MSSKMEKDTRVEYIVLCKYEEDDYKKIKKYVSNNMLNNSYPNYIDLYSDETVLVRINGIICEFMMDYKKYTFLVFNIYNYVPNDDPELEYVAVDNTDKDLMLSSLKAVLFKLDKICGVQKKDKEQCKL